jgi:ribosomal-protein-alanine N-acetyltransferase
MQIFDIDFCSPGDADEIFGIASSCFDVPWEKKLIESDLDDPGETVYLKAEANASGDVLMAGFCVLESAGAASRLSNIAVRPEFRRRGVASQLLTASGEVALERGHRRIILEVRPSNEGARRFYDSFGFAYSSRAKGYYSDGEDALVLVARLPFEFREGVRY